MKSYVHHRSKAVLAVLLLSALSALADDWPQWRGPNRDGVWRETGLVEKLNAPQLPIRWRMPISSGYSGPTVAGGRVYVMDRVTEPKQMERVHCFNAANGGRLWLHEYPCDYRKVSYTAGPRASVTVAGGRAYALGTMGNLTCLDAATGVPVWQKDCAAEYRARIPIWGVASSPVVEGNAVIVIISGRDGACVVAFDTADGRELWRALDDEASYSSPIVIDQAGKRVLICWTGKRVAALDAATGRLYWDHAFIPSRMAIGIATPVYRDGYLLVTSFYDGAMLLKLAPDRPAAELVWRRKGPDEYDTDALHCCISTPLILGGHIYGVDSHGQLRCLDLKTGDRLWEDLTAVPKARWANIHMVENGDRVWMFNERGELIISRLSPQGFHEISRAKLIKPTLVQLDQADRGGVCWSHPAYADRCIFIRNDEEILCADLAK